jgi:5'-nucleotidase
MSYPRKRGRLAALGVAAATSVALIASTGVAPAVATSGPAHNKATHQKAHKPAASKLVDLQILALNDFHGQLEPSTSSTSGVINGTPAGGAEYLATHLQQLRASAAAEKRHSVTVAAGDLIGATPLVSAAFHDEPTIEAMNEMGLDISSVGNHEFDEGWRELVRMQNGGCIDDGDGAANQNSCADHEFAGADFQYLSANVFREDTGKTVFPGTTVKEYDGVKVGFIGMTLENTPNIVTKAGVEGLRFTDEVETANAAAKALQKQGVKSIVVLVHEGGFPADATAYNSCPGISGPIVDINAGLSDKIDAVVTGHTHQAYNCKLLDPAGQPRLVTSGANIGRLVTDIDLSINRRSGDVVRSSEVATNRIVTRDVAKAEAITALIKLYKDLVAPIADKVIGSVNPDLSSVTRTNDASGESPLGNLIADSQRTDPSVVTGGKVPDIAFMNPGGIRSDLAVQDNGDVTYGAAFTVQPFNNYVVSMDMTGAQVLTALEQQWSGPTNTAAKPVILQVSGITYSYTHPAGGAYTLLPETVKVNGTAIDPAKTYRVVVNSFLSDGGDGIKVFADATNKYFGGLDIDSLATFLAAHPGYTPGPTDRITVAP